MLSSNISEDRQRARRPQGLFGEFRGVAQKCDTRSKSRGLIRTAQVLEHELRLFAERSEERRRRIEKHARTDLTGNFLEADRVTGRQIRIARRTQKSREPAAVAQLREQTFEVAFDRAVDENEIEGRAFGYTIGKRVRKDRNAQSECGQIGFDQRLKFGLALERCHIPGESGKNRG